MTSVFVSYYEKTGQMVDRAAEGDVIIIKRRGKPIAELRRYAAKPAKKPDFRKRYAKDPFLRTDSGKILEEDRR